MGRIIITIKHNKTRTMYIIRGLYYHELCPLFALTESRKTDWNQNTTGTDFITDFSIATIIDIRWIIQHGYNMLLMTRQPCYRMKLFFFKILKIFKKVSTLWIYLMYVALCIYRIPCCIRPLNNASPLYSGQFKTSLASPIYCRFG